MSDCDQLLLDAYKGELFGNALFEEMPGRDDWADHRATLQALAAIEQRTADTLRPLVEAAGIDTGDEDEPRGRPARHRARRARRARRTRADHQRVRTTRAGRSPRHLDDVAHALSGNGSMTGASR